MEKLRRVGGYLLAPVLTLGALGFVFLMYQLFPFGEKTMAWCDMNQQVIPLLMDFKDILAGKSGLLMNLQNAAGMSFWPVFLFFISSPFSFLSVFVAKADMYIFMNILVLLKLALCAFTATLFFRRHFVALDLGQTAALSVGYALCGYGMLYYQNIVWLDMMALFPLLLMGLLRLVRFGKPLMYILVLSAVVVVNFYLSYMVVLFLLLAIAAYLLFCVPREARGKASALLFFASFLAALMTAVVWLPSLSQYLQSARTGDLLGNLRQGGFFTRLDTTLPVLLCSTVMLAAIPLLAIRRNHDRKTRFATVLFLLMLIPVLVEPVNKMWHTGSYQAFPVRYGYMTVLLGFVLMAMAIGPLNQGSARESNPIAAFFAMLAVAAIFVTVRILVKQDFTSLTPYTRSLWGNAQSLQKELLFASVILLTAVLLLWLYKFRLLGQKMFSVLLCLVVLCEGGFSAEVYMGSAASSDRFYRLVAELENQIDDDGLYRVKNRAKYFDANLVGAMGYGTLNHYTSLTGKDYMYAMKKLGYSSYWMEVNSNGGTELTDALMGNRYEILYTHDVLPEDVSMFNGVAYSIIERPFPLPVGLILNSNIAALEYLSEGTRMDRQQALFTAVTGSREQLITKYAPEIFSGAEIINENGRTRVELLADHGEGYISYNIEVNGTQTLYFDCFDALSNKLVEPVNTSFNVLVNGKQIETQYPSKDNNGLVDLGTYTDSSVIVTLQVLNPVEAASLGVWGMDQDVLRRGMANLVSADLHENSGQVSGTATGADENSYLFLPVTWDEGFQAQVNGKPAEIHRVMDSFMAVKLEPGENTVSFTFVPSGFALGAGISIAGLILFVGFLWLWNRRKERLLAVLEKPALVLFWIGGIGVLSVIYLFPTIVYFTKPV